MHINHNTHAAQSGPAFAFWGPVSRAIEGPPPTLKKKRKIYIYISLILESRDKTPFENAFLKIDTMFMKAIYS